MRRLLERLLCHRVEEVPTMDHQSGDKNGYPDWVPLNYVSYRPMYLLLLKCTVLYVTSR